MGDRLFRLLNSACRLCHRHPHFGHDGLSFWIAHRASLPYTLHPEPFRLGLDQHEDGK